jgi:trimethylamine corrinoid protein
MHPVPYADDLTENFTASLLAFDRVGARRVLQQALTTRSPLTIAEEVVTPALETIGQQWEVGQLSLSQVFMSGRICEELVDQFLPPADPSRKGHAAIAIAVLDDHHTMGKRIVRAALRANGYEVLDLGHALKAPDLAQKAAAANVRLLLVSVLMLRSALQVPALLAALDRLNTPIPVVVGGAPFLLDPELYLEVGAAAMGRNGADAVAIVRGFEERGLA